MFTSLFLRMLNKEAASSKNRPQDIIDRLEIREGCAVADLGAGGGYFTLEFARKVGSAGKVYAIDTRPAYLAFIRGEALRGGLDTIRLVQATQNEVHLPQASLDLIFVRNVFHHLPTPAAYFHRLRTFLKSEGRVAIIEHKPKGGFSFVALFKHATSSAMIIDAMSKAGYFLAQSFDFLPNQTFNVFGVK